MDSPNPKINFDPKLKDIARIVGGCNPAVLTAIGQVYRIKRESFMVDVYFMMIYSKKDVKWVCTLVDKGGLESVNQEEQAAFLAIPDRPDWV